MATRATLPGIGSASPVFSCDIRAESYPNVDQAEKCEMRHSTETVADIIEEQRAAETHASNVPQPLAAELLGRAAMHMHDRANTYDKPDGERSMGRTVAAFNAITGRDLTESEGWLFMAVLKQTRLFTRKDYHQDSAEDAIAYLALLAEARGAGR